MVKIGIIGAGRQGGKYIKFFLENRMKNAELKAICDIDVGRFDEVDPSHICEHYTDYKLMLSKKTIDAIIIDTPHYLHPVIALEAVKYDIHVLSDKPLGVDAYTVKKLKNELSGRKLKFGVLFNQRMLPVYQRIKEIIENQELGKLKRCVWEVTDWYRPQKYYDIGGWRSTWKGEGGGVLINQCVHNIDMIQHLFGMPLKINSSIEYGVYHKTEIDDSVVANFMYSDGFMCTLISSTGETPGTNRLEISGTKGKLVFDVFDKLKFELNDIPEDVFSNETSSPRYMLKFGKPGVTRKEEKINTNTEAHVMCIQDFINAIVYDRKPSADYYDGLACVQIINAIYYSDWKGKKVELPVDELEFKKMLEGKY